MIVSQELLLRLEPGVHILVALEHDRLVKALGEALEEGSQLLSGVLSTDTQLQEHEKHGGELGEVRELTCTPLELIIMVGQNNTVNLDPSEMRPQMSQSLHPSANPPLK